MKNVIYAALMAGTVFACGPRKGAEQPTPSVPTLALKWQTDTLMTTSESVIFDNQNNVLYVANINGNPTGKDGNGFISKVSLEGGIMEHQWITGMDAPKGMGIHQGKLYVTDIDRIHEIDIAAQKIVNTYPVPGAKFLNDITTGSDGSVYISDMDTHEILVLANGTVSKWLTGQPAPNGLLAEGNTLWMALWNDKTVNAVDMASKQVTLKADSIENPDGIEAVEDGGYLVSSWNGVITYVAADGKTSVLLDTRADSVSAADIEYIAEKRLLLVPTFFKNTVVAYELVK
ncbi:MAG: ATP-binding protein [Cyclobacteriaceae bacterium]|jgi:sugar lactone lactonase YvrE|nr:ATP-binding protein [Cyclobacteriaceae bacterium]